MLQARIREAWKPLYRFGLEEQHRADYEVCNWYVSTHPQSHFVSGLMAGRAAPGCRYALRNNVQATHRLEGGTQRRVLGSVAELREVLETVIRVAVPEGADVDDRLARLIEAAPEGAAGGASGPSGGAAAGGA